MRWICGTLAVAMLCAAIGCSGVYHRKGRCIEVEQRNDGTKVVRECESEEWLKWETKSLREIFGDSWIYYYRTEVIDTSTNQVLDSWEYDTLSELVSFVPEMIDASGWTYDDDDVEWVEGILTTNWVDPETDWHNFN